MSLLYFQCLSFSSTCSHFLRLSQSSKKFNFKIIIYFHKIAKKFTLNASGDWITRNHFRIISYASIEIAYYVHCIISKNKRIKRIPLQNKKSRDRTLSCSFFVSIAFVYFKAFSCILINTNKYQISRKETKSEEKSSISIVIFSLCLLVKSKAWIGLQENKKKSAYLHNLSLRFLFVPLTLFALALFLLWTVFRSLLFLFSMLLTLLNNDSFLYTLLRITIRRNIFLWPALASLPPFTTSEKKITTAYNYKSAQQKKTNKKSIIIKKRGMHKKWVREQQKDLNHFRWIQRNDQVTF